MLLDVVNPLIFENGLVIDIGLEIEKLIKTANKASQGLIMTFYSSTLMYLIIILFQMVSNLTLNDVHTDKNKIVIASICIFILVMYLIRLHILMKSGQVLANRIQQSRIALEDNIISQETSSKRKEGSCNKLFVLRKRLQVYQWLYPIAPYSVFTLSSRTFFATLATILTYIVVLIKLRSAQTSNALST